MADDRPKIPEPIKREVRQRCGFGCVFCGLPLYEYEHMEAWAKVLRHVASEITLLCDKHHREKTSGLLPLDVVREADRSPHNKRAGVTPPYDLHYAGTSCNLVVGGNGFYRAGLVDGTETVALMIDRIPLLAFAFEQDHLFLTVRVYDERSQPILWVDRNELRYCPNLWDIRLEGRNLTIREGQGEFLLDIVFNPPTSVEVNRGRFALNGLEFVVRPDKLCYVNNLGLASGLSFYDLDVAIMTGERMESRYACIYYETVNRGGANREAAKEWMRLHDLHEKGSINEEEFQSRKDRYLGEFIKDPRGARFR